ncbi:alpha mannosidase-like protein [Fistulina hepatica ATCC 64428]|uniref:alpha-1,2-Mannosidase n=1 Tax=Fistulina hepatica ATCC 64428 TaxID=1128425 RepID=A0A0D7AJ17_9AGAR|nr:alpha mannosidase-like protein [Fistulina hepatica ATCC 64428]
MKWGRYWPESLLVLILLFLGNHNFGWNTQAAHPLTTTGWSTQRKLAARERTRDLWYHGFNNYMNYAFPLDELTPLTCSGQGPDWANPANIAANDVAGNFSLTLVDVLDTLVVLDDLSGFESAVRAVIDHVSFDVDTKPQVFETTIRVMGGLLSAHIFANSTGPFHLDWYHSELLDLAYDLGKRLLPAFSTPTGLPYARINLRHGLVKDETFETCSAGAGSLILEFATLSRLTGDDRFERAARKAFFAIWNRKSAIGLVGNTINVQTGVWISPQVSGIQAGIDSFWEYALKWYIMSGDIEFLDVWDDAYAAIMRYSRSADGTWYRHVNMESGDLVYNTVDSLSAFWPGVQVLAGDVQNAIKAHLMYFNLWRKHGGLPEVYDTNYKIATSQQYPLRPEFVESTWYLYRATRDPFYLDVGERILFDITTRAKVECGLTGIQDLRTNKREDRMESFTLSETLKYLFLLFDEENVLHQDDSNYVFTTEGHILTLTPEQLLVSPAGRRTTPRPRVGSPQCPAYTPFMRTYNSMPKGGGLVGGVRSRPDYDYARQVLSLSANSADEQAWSLDGWCEKPKVTLFSYDFVLSANGKNVPEDLSPSYLKLALVPDGYIVHNVTGIRVHIVQRIDGKGYDIRKVGHYSVRPGQLVYVDDPSILQPRYEGEGETLGLDVTLRVFYEDPDPLSPLDPAQAAMDSTGISETFSDVEALVTGYVALFGGDIFEPTPLGKSPLRMTSTDGVPLARERPNDLGCEPYHGNYTGAALVVTRGTCTFLEKLIRARDAGAAGVIVISDDDMSINPTTEVEDLAEAGDISDVVLLIVRKSEGQVLLDMLDAAQGRELMRVMLQVDTTSVFDESEPSTPTKTQEERKGKDDGQRILYINGHPLLNTRLLI